MLMLPWPLLTMQLSQLPQLGKKQMKALEIQSVLSFCDSASFSPKPTNQEWTYLKQA